MRPILTLVAIVAVLGGSVFVYKQATATTPEQDAAARSLDRLDVIEEYWKEHKERPMADDGGVFSTTRFTDFAGKLRSVDLEEVDAEVKAVHERFRKYCAGAPDLIRKLQDGPDITGERGARVVEQKKAEDWVLEMRNLNIQLELLTRDIDKQIDAARGRLTKVKLGKA